MSKKEKMRVLMTFVFIFLASFALIFLSVKDGLARNDVMLRFAERQTVTFLSALTLGLTGLISLFIYSLKRKMKSVNERYSFWLYSGLGFFYLCIDEYFMAHEGIDSAVASLFGSTLDDMNLDGLVIGFFGLIGLAVCVYFRRAILQYKVMLPFLISGAVFLLGTIICNQFEHINIYVQVIEESSKIIGVFMFFAAYLLALLSFSDRFYLSEKIQLT